MEVYAKDFVEFLNEACTAFHAVDAAARRLVKAGFQKISECDEWKLVPGGKYFFTRNGTSLIAFTVGEKYESGNGFTILGAHTDSPCLKIKPVVCTTKSNSLMLNTQPYGGGLWHTWFDRDLGIAGRVIVTEEDGSIGTRLVRIDEPIARIPNLSIHLTSGAERESFSPNLHEHAKALLTMNPSLLSMASEGNEHSSRLHPCVVGLVAKKLGISPSSIEDLELQLIDVQPSTVGGIDGEYVFSGRLDNLCSTYQSLRAVIDGVENGVDHTNVRMCILFDHEEIGSNSTTGAGSSMFMNTLTLVVNSLNESYDKKSELLMRTLRKSLVVSADMAHGLHPNYAHKHDATMAPVMNHGLVIKHNANQRYATNSVSASIFRRFAKMENIPVQEFTVRSDSACGSTIGPIIATLSGILTVDCGSPQFSMHSIREMMASADAYYGYRHLLSALKNHPSIDMTNL